MDLKKVSYGIIIFGLVLIIIPQKVSVSYADEQVLLWTDTITVSAGTFNIQTGSLDDGDGFGHTLKLWNSGGFEMNASAENIADPDNMIYLYEGGIPRLEFFVGENSEYDIEITGTVETENQVEVTGEPAFFRHLEPDNFWVFPYRVHGMGIGIIGVLAALGLYLIGRRNQNA